MIVRINYVNLYGIAIINFNIGNYEPLYLCRIIVIISYRVIITMNHIILNGIMVDVSLL